jgi:hypothetical protein
MMNDRDVRATLRRVDESLKREPECPYHLVKRAIAIQVQDDEPIYSLQDAEADLLGAHRRDPAHLEALEELAHFYDAVIPDSEKAKAYAQLCRDRAAKLVDDMDRILAADD